MVRIKYCLLSLPIAAASFVLAAEPGIEEPVKMLRQSMQPPAVSYHGQMVISHWNTGHSDTEEVMVHFRTPNLARWEYLKPDGSVDRIVVSDGTEEQLRIFPNQKSYKCKAAKSCTKQMTTSHEWELLLQNYHVSLIGYESVAGRRTAVLQLTPLVDGKPLQRLWIDEQTGVVLGVKRYRPSSELAALSKFIEFGIGSSLPPEAFRLAGIEKTPDEPWLDPDFLSAESFARMTGQTISLPSHLPLGFELESADSFILGDQRISHFRYTDGLNVISVFETSKPARPPQTRQPENQIYQGKLEDKYLTLIGDVSQDVLKKIYHTFHQP